MSIHAFTYTGFRTFGNVTREVAKGGLCGPKISPVCVQLLFAIEEVGGIETFENLQPLVYYDDEIDENMVVCDKVPFNLNLS